MKKLLVLLALVATVTTACQKKEAPKAETPVQAQTSSVKAK